MPRNSGWIAAIVVVVAVIGAYAWLQRDRQALLPVAPVVEAPPPAKVDVEPQIRHPLPQIVPPVPLPPLSESDALLREALAALAAGQTLGEHALFTDFVRRVVATVDNLPTQKINLRLLPVKPAPGRFMTATDASGITVQRENSARYAAYMRLVEAVDPAKVVALYVRFYPLFQQAYQELGYPKGYFNDRLMVVIDDLLAAPEVPVPVRLVQPKVMFEFADPELEARSAGQKILMRMGNANAATIKARLRAIRSELVALAPKPAN